MTLANYQFQIGDTVFDGGEATGATFRLLNFGGLERTIRDKDSERPDDHGIVMAGADLLAHRVMSLEVMIYGTAESLQANIDALSRAWAPTADGTNTALRFKMPGVNERFVTGRPRRFGVSAERWAKGYAKAALEFVADSPYIFGDARSGSTSPRPVLLAGLNPTDGTYAGNGHPGTAGINPTDGTYAGNNHPGPTGIGFTDGGSTGDATVANGGIFSAPWVLKLTGPLTSPRILHVEQGYEISFNQTIAAGEIVELSSVDHTVTVNGTSRYSWLDQAQWFSLVPGPNTIRLYSDDGGDTGTARIEFNDTYV